MQCFHFYVNDWLSSSHIECMDAHEERGYLRLLLRAATEPDCGLPDNDAELAIISKLDRQWNKPTREKKFRFGKKTSGQKIRECFFMREGRLFNERLLKEFDYQNESHIKRSQAGQKANDVRWGSNRRTTPEKPDSPVPIGSQSDPNRIPNVIRSESQNHPNSNSNSNSTEEEHTEVSNGSRSAAPQQPESARASSQESKNAEAAAMRWLEFRQMAEQRAIKGTSVDWDAAFDKWEQISVHERIKAFRGLAVRPLSSDQELRYRTNVTKYFERKLWEESETTPALNGNSASAASNVYRPWQPPQALIDQRQAADKKPQENTIAERSDATGAIGPKLISRNGSNG